MAFNKNSFFLASTGFIESVEQSDTLAATVALELLDVATYDEFKAAKVEFICAGFAHDFGAELSEHFRAHGTAGLEDGSKNAEFRFYENKFNYCVRKAAGMGWEKPVNVTDKRTAAKSKAKPSNVTVSAPEGIEAEVAAVAVAVADLPDFAVIVKLATVNSGLRDALMAAAQAYLHPLAAKPSKGTKTRTVAAIDEMEDAEI